MGENSGPAPASENLITSIPTVKITSEQARMLFYIFIFFRKQNKILNLFR
jgi:hypothetical protein